MDTLMSIRESFNIFEENLKDDPIFSALVSNHMTLALQTLDDFFIYVRKNKQDNSAVIELVEIKIILKDFLSKHPDFADIIDRYIDEIDEILELCSKEQNRK